MSDEDSLTDNFLDEDAFPPIDDMDDAFGDTKTPLSGVDDLVRDGNDDDDEGDNDDDNDNNPLFDNSFDDRDLL